MPGSISFVMIDLQHISDFSVSPPPGWTIFGSEEQFRALPDATKDQIVFLDKQATDYLLDLAHTSRLITSGGWDPFKDNFRSVETFNRFSCTDESRQLLKKWLYHRGIRFSNQVFVLQNNDNAILTTWKMILRYSPVIFPGDDVMIFDQTLNWCLFYYHEDMMFFGRDKIYDPSQDDQKMQELNERKRKFPQFRHPYL